jgi:hypothetical protein
MTTYPPPPASRATARGADHGWNDDDDEGTARRVHEGRDTGEGNEEGKRGE